MNSSASGFPSSAAGRFSRNHVSAAATFAFAGGPFHRLHRFQAHARLDLGEERGQPLRVVADERSVDVARAKARMQQHEIGIAHPLGDFTPHAVDRHFQVRRKGREELVAAGRPLAPVDRHDAARRRWRQQFPDAAAEVIVRLPRLARHDQHIVRRFRFDIGDAVPLETAVAAQRLDARTDRSNDGRRHGRPGVELGAFGRPLLDRSGGLADDRAVPLPRIWLRGAAHPRAT